MERHCIQCGALIPSDALEGQCLRCLVLLGAGEDESHSWTTEPEVPQRLGDYELLGEIARGGMGIVFRARQLGLKRIVALKLLHAGRFATEQDRRRFRAEAGAAAKLQHPNVVPVHDIGEHDGQLFFSMDYVEGPTLAGLLREGPLPPRRAANYVRMVADAVEHAHRMGILHRDLKPSNILIDLFDAPRVTDFGLSRELSSGGEETQSGQTLGSPNYLPPEQISSRHGMVGPASDVYSLGAVLYHTLAGRPPFAAGTIHETLQQVASTDPPAPRLLNPFVPRDLETICLKCLAKEPTRRYGSAQALAEDLENWLNGLPILARPVGSLERWRKWVWRHRALSVSLGAAVVILVSGTVVSTGFWIRAERARRETVDVNARLTNLNTRLEIQRADSLFLEGRPQEGVAALAAVLRHDSGSLIAAERLLSALTYGPLPRAVSPPLLHSRGVDQIVFEPAGGWFAAKEDGNEVRVWRADGTPMPGKTMRQEQALSAIAVSANGRYLATTAVSPAAGQSGEAVIWNPQTGDSLHRIELSTSATSVDFNPSSSIMAVAAQDGSVTFWDPSSGEKRGGFRTGTNSVLELRFSPDGNLVATALKDGTARLWKVAPVREERVFPCADGVISVRFSADGGRLLTLTEAEARVWDVATGRAIGKPLRHEGALARSNFSPDGSRVVTSSYDNTARLWDAATGEAIGVPMRHTQWVGSAVFSPDGGWVLTSSFDGSARIWDAKTGTAVGPPLRHEWWVFDAVFSPDGRRVVTASMDQTVRVWEPLSTAALPQQVLAAAMAKRFALSHDGRRLACGGSGGMIRLIETTSRSVEWAISMGSNVITGVAFSPDSSRLLAWSGATGELFSIVDGGATGASMVLEKNIQAACFSRDGSSIATGDDAGVVRLWDGRTATPLGPPLIPESPPDRGQVLAVDISSDNRWVASGSFFPSNARIFDVATGRSIAVCPHRGPVRRVRFHPDGRHLVTGSDDNTAGIWSVTDGRRLAELRHEAPVGWIDLSPDGRTLATASEDGNARLWDAQNGHPLALIRHGAAVRMISFSKDGHRLVTASWDQTARIWDAATGLALSEPLRGGAFIGALFSQNGRQLWTLDAISGLQSWEILPAEESAPGWLPDLAEAYVERRATAEGVALPVSAERWPQLRSMLATNAPGPALYRDWLRWFLADPAKRTPAPIASP